MNTAYKNILMILKTQVASFLSLQNFFFKPVSQHIAF